MIVSNQQGLDEQSEAQECRCTPSTSLFDLCPTCADKAWHYGHVMRKRDQAKPAWDHSGYDYRDHGDGVAYRTSSGWRHEYHGKDDFNEDK